MFREKSRKRTVQVERRAFWHRVEFAKEVMIGRAALISLDSY
jgi:hypothetical protein